jgi:hypothetical protein
MEKQNPPLMKGTGCKIHRAGDASSHTNNRETLQIKSECLEAVKVRLAMFINALHWQPSEVSRDG